MVPFRRGSAASQEWDALWLPRPASFSFGQSGAVLKYRDAAAIVMERVSWDVTVFARGFWRTSTAFSGTCSVLSSQPPSSSPLSSATCNLQPPRGCGWAAANHSLPRHALLDASSHCADYHAPVRIRRRTCKRSQMRYCQPVLCPHSSQLKTPPHQPCLASSHTPTMPKTNPCRTLS
jgi:hypothetical protein